MIGTDALAIARDLAREAIFAWMPARPQFNRGAPLTWSGTGIGVVMGPAGPGLSFSGGAGTGRVLSAGVQDSPAATYIFVTSSISALSGGGGLGRIVSSYNGTGGHDIAVQSNGSTETLRSQEFYSGGGGAFEFVGTGNLLQSARPRVGAVVQYGVAGVAPIAALDGVFYTATQVGAAGSGTRAAGGIQVGVGCRPDSTARQLSGNVFGAVKIARALSAAEIQAVTQSIEAFEALFEVEELDLIFARPAATGSPYTLTAAAGAFTESGQAAGLLATRTIAGAAGTFTETGQDAGLIAARTVTGAAGTFAETGQDAGLRATRTVAGAAGAFTLTGQDAALTYTPAGAYTMPAAAGSFSETGQAAGLLATRTLAGAAGSFSETGQDATLLHARLMAAAPGSFAFTGTDATLVYTPSGNVTLAAAAGSFALTGQVADLQYSGATRLARARSTGRITQTATRPAALSSRRRT